MSDVSLKLDRTPKRPAEPVGEMEHHIGRFASPVRESLLKNFIANLKDFLTERPVKVRGGGPAAFTEPEFGAGFSDNVKEFFKPNPRGRVNSDLLVNWNAGFGGFWQNLRDTISPPKLPPLQVSSQPVAVKDIWSKNTQFTRVQMLSIAFHVVILVLIIVPLAAGTDVAPHDAGKDLQRHAARVAVSAETASGSEEGRRRRRWRRAQRASREQRTAAEVLVDAVHAAQSKDQPGMRACR